jgi:hypothetical protein
MGKKIIITESQEQALLEYFVMEKTYPIDPNKVLLVKKYLDKHFKRGKLAQFGADGMPEGVPVVGVISEGKDNNIVKNLTARQLLDLLIDEFRGMFSDKIQRSKFIAQVIKDWYAGKISKEGLLSTTHC